jgi:hypothetical protein
MVLSEKANSHASRNIMVKGKALEQVDQFTYRPFGSMVTADARSGQEIKRRIGIAKIAFKLMENILTSKNVTFETRLLLLKCYIWSTLFLYDCEN